MEPFAERTGLEPATSAVTGQHSNQLNYRSFQNEPLICTNFLIFSDGKDKGKVFCQTKLFKKNCNRYFYKLSYSIIL